METILILKKSFFCFQKLTRRKTAALILLVTTSNFCFSQETNKTETPKVAQNVSW